MEKKRKLPARAAARAEPASKKRQPTPAESERIPSPSPKVEEPLPTSISASRPLPTVDQLQPSNLPSAQYQSVQESGVLAESLERSKKKWMSEGVFEKYWTKPSAKKKKDAPDLEKQNPPKESMVKIGTCTITIEPHVFEAVMYTIKDTTSKPPPPRNQAMYRPIMQFGPPNGTPSFSSPTALAHGSPPHGQPGVASPVSQQSIPPNQPQSPYPPQASNGTGVRPQPHASSQQSPPSQSSISQSTGNSNVAHVQHTPHPPPAPQPVINPPVGAPPSSSDPVIQMLAERAASDQELKSLMRIVADGKASPAELKRFQAHIDELTRLLQSRNATAPAAPPPHHSNQMPPAPMSAQMKPSPTPASPLPKFQGPLPTSYHQYQSPQPQALRSKIPPPPPKPDISAVCLEFTGGSGDRFLFPKYSIIDFAPGNMIIASFLIVRRGSSADAKTYDPKLDYYQPITIRIYVQQSKHLDTFAKVVAPADEVRKYMDDVMDNMTRAEYVLLAMQLPREVPLHIPPQDVNVVTKSNHLPPGPLWTVSADPGPQTQKYIQHAPTEEDQYKQFISTIS